MSAVYRPLNLIQTPMVFTNTETAEVTKYAGNAFLATKITFINEIADLCEKVGADVHDVARGIGLDGRMARKVIDFCGGSVSGLTVGVLGLTFKANTDDMRDAPSLDIVPALQAAGARIVAFDPEGMQEAGRMIPGITFAKTAYEAAFEADVLVVITEWHEFRGLDPRRIKQVMRQPRIVDLRNIFNPEEMRGLGFAYEGVGRPKPRN